MTEAVLEQNDEQILAIPQGGDWQLILDARRGAALDSLTVGGQTLARSSSFYVDDVPDAAGIPGKAREFRKTGAAVLSGGSVLPVGAEISLARTWRVAGNHARVTADLKWPRGAIVRRHLGLDGLVFPGDWKSMHCIPPLQQLAEGAVPSDRKIPPFEGERTMIGHWHRPPLALVFRDAQGRAVEVGTGDDLWRWEQSLGYGPESGSYKVFRIAEGVEFVREPLMCCEEFEPEVRQYRFTWHLAWSQGASEEADPPPGNAVADWDFASMDWHPASRRQLYDTDTDTAAPSACFASAAAQKAVRRRIRQLAEAPEPGELRIRGVAAEPCTVSSHVRRGDSASPLAHWDLHALMGLSEWARQALGRDWAVTMTAAGMAANLPSVQGLFQPSGFELQP